MGTQASPPLTGPELAAVQTGGVCTIMGTESPRACGCHATLVTERPLQVSGGTASTTWLSPEKADTQRGARNPRGPKQITGLVLHAGLKGSPLLCGTLSPPTALGSATYSPTSPEAGRKGGSPPQTLSSGVYWGAGTITHRWVCSRGPDRPLHPGS